MYVVEAPRGMERDRKLVCSAEPRGRLVLVVLDPVPFLPRLLEVSRVLRLVEARVLSGSVCRGWELARTRRRLEVSWLFTNGREGLFPEDAGDSKVPPGVVMARLELVPLTMARFCCICI